MPNMLNAQGIGGSPVQLQLISPSGSQMGNQMMPANNQQPIQYVQSINHMQQIQNRNLNKMSSRERQKMMVPNHQQQKLAAYGSGVNTLASKRGSVGSGGVRH